MDKTLIRIIRYRRQEIKLIEPVYISLKWRYSEDVLMRVIDELNKQVKELKEQLNAN